MSLHTREELHKAAADVIGILKTIPEFKDSKIAVIGGLALWKYLRRGRTTEVLSSPFSLTANKKLTQSRMLTL